MWLLPDRLVRPEAETVMSQAVPFSPVPVEPDAQEAMIIEMARRARPPMYSGKNVRPAHSLQYDWTGWLSEGGVWPEETVVSVQETAALWAGDGFRLVKAGLKAGGLQILFSVTPFVSPVFFATRVKGRLQHALRKAGCPVKFSRKVSVRVLGENTDGVVERYVQGLVGKGEFADPRFAERMKRYTLENSKMDLEQATASRAGRYWYNLHVALRGDVEQTPHEIALAFQNGTARALHRGRIWADGYYVGSFSGYGLDVIRRIAGLSWR